MLGKVEVLDAEPALVADRIEAREHRVEIDDTGRIVDVHLRLSRATLAQLDVVGEVKQLARIAAPVRDVAGVDQESYARHLGAKRAHRLDRIHDRARVRLEQRVRCGPPPTHGAIPGTVDVGVRRGCRAPHVDRLRERGRATDRQRQRRGIGAEERIDVRVSVGRRRGRAGDDVAARGVDDVDDAERPAHGDYDFCIDVGITMPTCCRCWPRPLSKRSATCSGVQPPSFHIHATCFGCWNIV